MSIDKLSKTRQKIFTLLNTHYKHINFAENLSSEMKLNHLLNLLVYDLDTYNSLQQKINTINSKMFNSLFWQISDYFVKITFCENSESVKNLFLTSSLQIVLNEFKKIVCIKVYTGSNYDLDNNDLSYKYYPTLDILSIILKNSEKLYTTDELDDYPQFFIEKNESNDIIAIDITSASKILYID